LNSASSNHLFKVLDFSHQSLFNQYTWFVKQKLKTEFCKYWDAIHFPSLLCILKQCVKTGSRCRVWETKGFVLHSNATH